MTMRVGIGEDLHRVDDELYVQIVLLALSVAQRRNDRKRIGEQAELQMESSELFKNLNSKRTAFLSAHPHAKSIIKPVEAIAFSATPSHRFLGNLPELANSLKHLKNTNAAVLLVAGGQAERLRRELSEEGVEAALSKTLLREPQAGETLILFKSLQSGFSYPNLGLYVFSENELFGYAREARHKRRSSRQGLITRTLSLGILLYMNCME